MAQGSKKQSSPSPSRKKLVVDAAVKKAKAGATAVKGSKVVSAALQTDCGSKCVGQTICAKRSSS